MRALGLGVLLGLATGVVGACDRSPATRLTSDAPAAITAPPAARPDAATRAAVAELERRTAAQNKPRAALIRRMDAYFARPNGVATWRALSGLGDPRIDPSEAWLTPTRTPDAHQVLDRLRPLWIPRPPNTSSGLWGSCRLDYATLVANRRIAALGEASPYVAQWFRVQRAVFAACADDGMRPRNAALVLPPPLAGLPPRVARLQDEDRAYQQASLDFYQGDSAAALKGFGAIGASSSPHRAIARYMTVAIRAGAGPGRPVAEDAPTATTVATPAASIAAINAILANPRLAEAHEISRSLLGWVSYTSEVLPARRAHVQAALKALRAPRRALVADADARADYARALTDLDFMMTPMTRPDWWIHGDVSPNLTANQALSEAARRDSLAAWIALPPSHFHAEPWRLAEVWDASDNSGAAWRAVDDDVHARAGSDGEAWTVLEATLSPFDGMPQWDALDADTAAVAQGHADDAAIAALPLLFYHQVRLALMDPRGPGPRDPTLFEAALTRLQVYPFKDSHHYHQLVSDALRYLMTTGRITEARRLRDATGAEHFAPLDFEPSDFGDDERRLDPLLLLLAEDDAHLASALRRPLDADKAAVLNLLSIDALQRLAARSDVDPALRALFARTAWARAYALGRAVPPDLDRLTRRLNPALTSGWRSRPGEASPGSHAALLDVLRSPALNIVITDHSRGAGENDGGSDAAHSVRDIDTYQHSDNNWWCAWDADRGAAAFEASLSHDFLADPRPADQRTMAAVMTVCGELAAILRQSHAVRSQSPAEFEALSHIDSAPRSLSLAAISWAQHPSLFQPHNDPAEALALAVRSTRYGCQWQGGHGPYSRTAFRLLHHLYGDTAAARRTPAWFDCSHFSGGCPSKAGAPA